MARYYRAERTWAHQMRELTVALVGLLIITNNRILDYKQNEKRIASYTYDACAFNSALRESLKIIHLCSRTCLIA